jgi:PTS system mannose-specific IIB component
MSIVLARIDNRLIHGQVLEAWVPYTHATCIAVANDELAGAKLKRIMTEAAVPRGIKVVIGTLEEVAASFRDDRFAAERVLLLFANSQDALKARYLGIDFDTLNLGNMHDSGGKMRFSCTIFLTREDVANLSELEKKGVSIVSRCVPTDRGQSWKKMIRQRE